MPEVLPTRFMNRWYRFRLPGDTHFTEMFAERYFDSKEDAWTYSERRAEEIEPRRIYGPVPSREDPNVWVVCVETLIPPHPRAEDIIKQS